MSYTLTKSSKDELDKMSQIIVDGWANDNLWQPIVRGGVSKDDQRDWLKGIFQASMAEPWHEYIKIVDDSTGFVQHPWRGFRKLIHSRREMIAWTILDHPAPMTKDAEEHLKNMPAPLPKMDEPLLGEFYAMLALGVPHGYDPEKDMR